MTLELKSLNLQSAAQEKADLLLVLVPQAEAGQPQKPKTQATAEGEGAAALEQLLQQAQQSGDFDPAKVGSQLALYSVAQVAARKVLLLGAAQAAPAQLCKAIEGAAAQLRQKGVKKAVVLALGDAAQDDAAVQALARALSAAAYCYRQTKPSEPEVPLQKIVLGVPSKARAQAAFEQALGVAAGIALARELGNLPANHATPARLAQTARELAKAKGISVRVHAQRELERLKMGAFLAVAQGSAQPPQFIELHYQGAPKTQPPVVLVGKGVTFDTGGISIKPAAGMDEMKFDMCGAASVLGVFQALARLQPRINVVGLVPATENMPGGKAIKPGDVVTSMSGQTIEVLNTDAEGRLILCDALSYAARFKPSAVIDIATLTGACVIALGGVRSGVFASDDALAQALLQAGEAAQDLGWRMPLDDDYGQGLKSPFADMANVAGREAGAVTAAKFLQKFAGDWPWAHLDIAGTAWKSGNAKGATGRPVGLLMHYLLGLATTPQTTQAAPQRKPASPGDQTSKAGKKPAAPRSKARTAGKRT
ncbi:leucyl aminopeptidase [Vandammella animalimorsus]|uniref:Probable cytosol aminopeptidase n=1 Tax=Vandammella animalimorsus TaxID=2029117 RepID=A0A2A2AJ39_9BURK|nr:leucyl aminopeptidase [Vandammella animalimorsus]PAT37763.1 leucyl aminopeptidase [Vandammella animalimorsus]